MIVWIASKTLRGRVWLWLDHGTHHAIVGAVSNADGTRAVYSVGTRAYIARRWKGMQ
jgi:hypothetical protein